jgi:hypothetical protein
MMERRNVWLLVLVVLLGAAGVVFYYFHGKRYEYRFTAAELQQKLSAQMPVEKTYLFIFQVTLDNVRVNLVEGSDRVNAGIDIKLGITLENNPLPLMGSIDASGGVRYEPATGELFLTSPRVESLNMFGVPERHLPKVSAALTAALQEYYASRPIYRLEGSAQAAAARLLLKSVTVEDGELVVRLGIG